MKSFCSVACKFYSEWWQWLNGSLEHLFSNMDGLGHSVNDNYLRLTSYSSVTTTWFPICCCLPSFWNIVCCGVDVRTHDCEVSCTVSSSVPLNDCLHLLLNWTSDNSSRCWWSCVLKMSASNLFCTTSL